MEYEEIRRIIQAEYEKEKFDTNQSFISRFARAVHKSQKERLPALPVFFTLRKRAGKTLREVEKATGISNSYISQLETGKANEPSYNTVRKLVNYYTKVKPQNP